MTRSPTRLRQKMVKHAIEGLRGIVEFQDMFAEFNTGTHEHERFLLDLQHSKKTLEALLKKLEAHKR